jgi:hypothetical protein
MRSIASIVKTGVRVLPRSHYSPVMHGRAVGSPDGIERLREQLVKFRASDIQVRRVDLTAKRRLKRSYGLVRPAEVHETPRQLVVHSGESHAW